MKKASSGFMVPKRSWRDKKEELTKQEGQAVVTELKRNNIEESIEQKKAV